MAIWIEKERLIHSWVGKQIDTNHMKECCLERTKQTFLSISLVIQVCSKTLSHRSRTVPL